jgi:EKC/KEOPS complex subunit PCC1/LAGE3
LANSALRALSVDKELSKLVSREYALVSDTVLLVLYAAKTNRMLRVSVNGFFESLGVVVQSMEELDLDVIDRPITQSLDGVQGLED